MTGLLAGGLQLLHQLHHQAVEDLPVLLVTLPVSHNVYYKQCCGSGMQNFPSRIQGQKDSGSLICTKEFKYFSPKKNCF
jgi:hypothetical protein